MPKCGYNEKIANTDSWALYLASYLDRVISHPEDSLDENINLCMTQVLKTEREVNQRFQEVALQSFCLCMSSLVTCA